LLGAIWYNLLTLNRTSDFPGSPLQDNLARSYEQLAHYLELKSRLFDPDIEEESQAPLYDLALANGQLVATLTRPKPLLTRLRGDRGQRGTRSTLHYYFAAQDIHERASSSHVQYAALREKFRYSDVMFRFQRLLSMQSQACQQLSRSILLRTPYQHDPVLNACLAILMPRSIAFRPAEHHRNRSKRWAFCSITCGRLMRSWRPLSLNRRWRCRAMTSKISLPMTACTALAICGYA
jgi:uncharacterized membrane protein YccC